MERNFASLRRSFPTMMASCNCVDFLQAVHDISSAWAQHLRESRRCSMSLADHRAPSACTSATLLLDSFWAYGLPSPAISESNAQAADPSDHPATPSLSPPLGAEGLEVAEPADSALLVPFRASPTAAVCPLRRPALQAAAPSDPPVDPTVMASSSPGTLPLPTRAPAALSVHSITAKPANKPPPLAAPALAQDIAPPRPPASAASNAGELVDVMLTCPGPAWPDSGCGCPLDSVRLCDDDTAWAGSEESGGAAEEAWMDGSGWACGGGAESELWSELASDSEEEEEEEE